MKDRNILETGPEEYPHYFRGRTQEKIKQGLADLAFLAKNLGDEDIEAVFKVLSNPALEEETSYAKEPFSRETVVNALALFIQANDLVGNQEEIDLESLVRDATFEAYHRNHPRRVIGAVNVNVESMSRQQAHDRGYRKLDKGDRLNSSEMRALIDAEESIAKSSEESQLTKEKSQVPTFTQSEIGEYVINNLEEIEPGLEVADFQLEDFNDHLDSQILCVDKEGEAVRVSWSFAPLSLLTARRMVRNQEEDSVSGQLRNVYVAVSAESDKVRSELAESNYKFCELRLGPHDVIKGIDCPNDS